VTPCVLHPPATVPLRFPTRAPLRRPSSRLPMWHDAPYHSTPEQTRFSAEIALRSRATMQDIGAHHLHSKANGCLRVDQMTAHWPMTLSRSCCITIHRPTFSSAPLTSQLASYSRPLIRRRWIAGMLEWTALVTGAPFVSCTQRARLSPKYFISCPDRVAVHDNHAAHDRGAQQARRGTT